jgi:aminoglycoside phosphotransferase (APT) family kinase protein
VTSTDATGGERLLDGRYRLGDRIGGGAVAEVFRAVDERLQRPVAVKVFRGDAAEQLQRHEAEMLTLAALDHPSLVTVFDAGTDEDSDRPYLVMQLVEGDTLADELRRGPLEAERTARYGAALADALAYVHERGLVHRDVKPANVLIAEDGRVHLADFGIARLVDAAHQTRTGDVLGTPAYFAPEQVAGEPVGPPADIYALAIVLIECLTGKRPFEGTAMEVAMARLARAPELPANLPGDWRELLTAMTARAPEGRPGAAQVAEGLRQIADGVALDRTVAMPAAAATPTVAMAAPGAGATQVMPVTAATAAPERTLPTPARRGPTALVLAVVGIVIAGLVVAIVLALSHRNSPSTTGGSPKHGTPKLTHRLERDVRQLENLVQQP